MAENNGWYYKRDEIIFGPFTRGGILNIYHRGVINDDTLIRYGSLPWQPLKTYLSTHQNQGNGMPRIRTILRSLRDPRNRTTLLIIAACVIGVFYLVARTSGKESPLAISHRPSVAHTAKPYSHPLQETLTPEKVVYYTNLARSQNGLPELRHNIFLDAIAEERARDMLEKGYFDHISPTGEKATSIAQKSGYRYSTLGENIAKGWYLNDREIVDGWMQSPGHRKNILNRDVTEIGAAIIKGKFDGAEAMIGVQIFGKQAEPVTE